MKYTALVFRFLVVVFITTTSAQELFAQLGFWTPIPAPPRMTVVYDIDMLDENFGICVGPADSSFLFAGIAFTTNGGDRWIEIYNDSTFIIPLARNHTVFRAVHIVNHSEAWVCGDSGQVYRTYDGGRSWEGLDSLYIGQHCTYRDIFFLDPSNGIIVGGDSYVTHNSINDPWYDGYILRTYDGGMTWKDDTPIGGYPMPDVTALYKVKASDQGGPLHIVGDFGLIMREGAGTWDFLALPPGGNDTRLLNIEPLAPPSYAVCGSNSQIGRGSGKVWRNFPWNARLVEINPPLLNTSAMQVFAMDWLTNELGWIGANQGYTAVTTNAGTSWTKLGVVPIQSQGPMLAMDFVDSLNGWACGGDRSSSSAWVMRYYGRPPKADISFTSTDILFPDVRCEAYVEEELIIRNSGTGTLIIEQGDITFSSGQYVLEGVTFPIRIASKKTLKVTIRWYPNPNVSGENYGTMTIRSNDPDHPMWVVSLKGTRYKGVLIVPDFAQSYSGICLGQEEEFFTYMQPGGNETPFFIDISFFSGDPEFEHLEPKTGIPITSATPLRFRFSPAQPGTREATFRVIGGNPNCPDTSFIRVQGTGLETKVRALTTVVDFGEVCIGNTRDQSITIENIGNTDAYIQVAQFVSGTPVFPVTYFGPVVIMQDSAKSYNFQFAPQAKGNVEAVYRLVVPPCNDTVFVTLRGKGIATEIAYSPQNGLTLGPTIVDTPVERFVTIRNKGETNAFLSDIELDPSVPGLTMTLFDNLPKMLAPNQEIQVRLTFRPVTVGEWDTKLATYWSGVCADSAKLPINAVCVPNPFIEPPSAMDIGLQPCPESIFDTLYIRNTGNGPLVFTNADISGPFRDHFTLISPVVSDTAFAQDSIALIVAYNNPNPGKTFALLILSHTDYQRMPTRINLTGERMVSEFIVTGDSATEFFTRLFVPELRTFRVRNNSQKPVTIDSIVVQSGASVFSVIQPPGLPITLGPGQELPFDVSFSPNGRGPFTGVIRAEGQPCEHNVLLTLKGRGDTDGLSVDRADIDLTLSPCDFETICDTIILANHGTESISVSDVTINTLGSSLQVTAPATPFNIGPGGMRPIIVCAEPQLFGMETGTLVIESNDPSYPQLTVVIRSNRDSVNLALSTEVIDFGMLPHCTPLPTHPFTITNTGHRTETVTVTRANGEPAFDMVLQTDYKLLPNKSVQYVVEFKRPSFGAFSDTLYIQGSSCPEVKTIILRGEWTDESYTVSPASIAFPNVNLGSASQRSFTITNNGKFDANITGVIVSPPGAFTVLPGAPASISAGGTGTFQIEFAPTAETDYTATVCVHFDAPCAETVCVDLRGTGVKGDLTLSPPELVFGILAQCQDLTLFDTLRNEGSGEIEITSSTIMGPGAAAFTVTDPVTVPETILPGGMRIFTVRCQPGLLSGDGIANATLSIITNDIVQPLIDLPLEVDRVTFLPAPNVVLAFGAIEPATPSVRTLTLTNNGSVRYCYEQPALPVGITVSVNFPLCIEPGQSVDIEWTFTPDSEGMYDEDVSLAVTAPCPDATVVTITADIQEGEITQTNRVDLPPGAYCLDRTFTIDLVNNHIYDATVDSVVFSGPDAAAFTLTNPQAMPFTVSPSASHAYTLRFASPNQSGVYVARFTSYLTVNGQQVTKVTELTAETVELALEVTNVQFPPTVTGQQSAPLQVVVSNPSGLPIEVSAITSSLGTFQITEMTPAPPVLLQPGEMVTLLVVFMPNANQQFTGSIEAVSTNPCPVTGTGTLTGEGIPREIVTANLTVPGVVGMVDDVVHIPILLGEDVGGTEAQSWSGSISFNRSMLWPQGVTTTGTRSDGMTVDMTYDYTEGRVTLSASGGEVQAGNAPLIYVDCLVLIGNDVSTTIVVSDDFDFRSGYARVGTRSNGMFTLDAYCNPEERLISGNAPFSLGNVSPNPVSLSGETLVKIGYYLPTDCAVRLAIHDAMGREVKAVHDGMEKSGEHSAQFTLKSMSPGVYYYTLTANGMQATKKLILVP